MRDTPEKKVITVEEVAEYLRLCEDHAHYHGEEVTEDAFQFAVKLVRAYGLNTAKVERRTE